MTPEQFKQAWPSEEDPLHAFQPDELSGLNLQPATIDFLTTAGLPNDAAPYISFYPHVRPLSRHYDFLEPEYDRYMVIGFCNDGDVIAINTDKNDQIAWLDHEDDFSEQFFNASIHNLAACLVGYREFVQTILKENGEDAYMNSDFTDQQFETLKQDIKRADSRALTEDGFWKLQLNLELGMREDIRKNR